MVIYLITNNFNAKAYCGQTIKKPNQRWLNHKSSANKKQNHPLYDSMNKHGADKFRFDIIDTAETLEELNKKEEFWIRTLGLTNPEKGYNLRSGGENKLHSEESKKKMSFIKIGKKASAETKEKIRILHTGSKRSVETKVKMSAWQIGKKHSAETKAKIGAARAGKKGNRTTPVYCHQTKETFHSTQEAANKLNIDRHNIAKVARGIISHIKGFTFSYLPKGDSNAF